MTIADTIKEGFDSRDPDMMAAAIIDSVVGAIADSVDPQTVTTRIAGGSIFKAIEWDGKIWSLDPSDTTTDHDEITCIRTVDSDGYFTNDVSFGPSVLSRSVTTPPTDTDSPAVQFGDQYLVPDGATDDWAGHEDERALYTARGWQFKPGTRGEIVMVEDEGETGEFIHFNNVDAWEDGLPGGLVDGSVRPSSQLIRFWAVENQTTTAPPASGPAAEQYIIGPSATGAWAGHDGKIAWRPATDAAFVITTPITGEEAYDKAQGKKFRRRTSTWVSAAGAFSSRKITKATLNALSSLVGSGTYAFDPTTAPTQATSARKDTGTLTNYQAAASGAELEASYVGTITGSANAKYVAALFYDLISAAVDWQEIGTNLAGTGPISVRFYWNAPDAAAHDYFVHIMQTGDGSGIPTINRRRLEILEV